MPKIERKHLVFKASIAGIKTRLLINNGSEAKLIDKSFVRIQKINTFKLKKKIKLTLGNGEVVQKLDSACLSTFILETTMSSSYAMWHSLTSIAWS